MTDNPDTISSARLSFLRDARVGRLATIDARGFPSVVPFCFALIDATDDLGPIIVSVLDEKPKHVTDRELARVRNILRNPEVGFVVDRYEEDWALLIFVQAKGIARLIETNDSLHAPALTALRVKYPQYQTMALEERAIIAIDQITFHAWRGDDQPFR